LASEKEGKVKIMNELAFCKLEVEKGEEKIDKI